MRLYVGPLRIPLDPPQHQSKTCTVLLIISCMSDDEREE